MTAPPRDSSTVRVCPVRDIVCSTPNECDQRETGCMMLINLPPELDHLRAATAPSADQDQNGGQGHEAYVHCSLGALPLESGNAREATCLNTEPSARTGTDTQQGQLGANAGSISAPPTSTPAAQLAEPVLPCAIDGCKQPSLMPASEYCSLHSAIGTSPTGGEFATQPAEPPAQAATDVVDECERLFWSFKALGDQTQTQTPLSDRDAFKRTVRPILLAATYAINKELRATVERQAREIAELRGLQERNEGRIKAIVDDALLQRAERAEAERGELRAARIAYASEFSTNTDGEPDTGSIHANIRALKAERDAMRECVRAADAMALECRRVGLISSTWLEDYDDARAKVKP